MNEEDGRIRALIQKREDYCEARKRSKILGKVKGIKNISSIKSAKKRILIPKVRNKDGEAEKTRQGIENVFAIFYEDLYQGEDDHNDEDMSSCIDHENADSSQIETFPEFTTEEIQAAVDRLKKGRRETAMEYEQNNCKFAVKTRKKRYGPSSMNLCSRKISPRKSGEGSEFKSSTKRVTGKTLAITGRYVGYQFYTS